MDGVSAGLMRNRLLAERLSKQRPWQSANENWFAAERALRQKPWRPWVIQFSGDKERSGWDWADLLLRASVPILILILSTAYSVISQKRQENIARSYQKNQEESAREKMENDVVNGYIKDIQVVILDSSRNTSTTNKELRGVYRDLTLAALSRIKNPDRKRLIIQFLFDCGLNKKPGGLFSLSEANLSRADLYGINLGATNLVGANLIGANLFGADISRTNLFYANLSKAMLYKADLSSAYLRKADLRGAILVNTNLKGADLQDLVWDKETKWPEPSFFEGAKNIPNALKKQLGL